MEIKIKNTFDIKQKAVVFGYNDFYFGTKKLEESSFININTDDGIIISVNGDDTREGKMKIMEESICKKRLKLKSIEFSSNNTKIGRFWIYCSDANGRCVLNPVFIQAYVKSSQQTLFPVIINSSDNDLTTVVDGNTAWLFTLEPNEEI